MSTAAAGEEVSDRACWRIGFVALCAACTNTAPTGSSAHPGTGTQISSVPSAGSQSRTESGNAASTSPAAEHPLVITTVLRFPPEVATPGPSMGPELDRVAEVLHANPAVEVEIDGHSDAHEAEEVAYARANLVASGLAGRGIPRARMRLKSFGHHQPAADGRSGRVEFKVLPLK